MLATVASVNSANRIKQYIFSNHSISSKVIQTPSSLTKEGCGYSVRFDDKHKQQVSQAGKKLKINIRAFYREVSQNNTTVYVKE